MVEVGLASVGIIGASMSVIIWNVSGGREAVDDKCG